MPFRRNNEVSVENTFFALKGKILIFFNNFPTIYYPRFVYSFRGIVFVRHYPGGL